MSVATRPEPEKDLFGKSPAGGSRPRRSASQLAFDLGHAPSHAEDDFLVTTTNQLAFDHVCAFPAWSAPLALITGGPMTGKSHLARIWTERSDAIVVTPQSLGPVAEAGGERPVLIEDVDRAGYDEHDLFHLLNQGIRNARPMLLTARMPVGGWPYLTEDVISRARLAAQFDVGISDDAELSQMFVKLFGDQQVTVDPRIINYLVTRMERSPAEVVALASLLDKLALSGKTAITRAIASEALHMRNAERSGYDPAEESHWPTEPSERADTDLDEIENG